MACPARLVSVALCTFCQLPHWTTGKLYSHSRRCLVTVIILIYASNYSPLADLVIIRSTLMDHLHEYRYSCRSPRRGEFRRICGCIGTCRGRCKTTRGRIRARPIYYALRTTHCHRSLEVLFIPSEFDSTFFYSFPRSMHRRRPIGACTLNPPSRAFKNSD
ncbi:hypothetical protein C8R45DRAFT_570007 [Mycena sanguinolenta]|nr:hypothetical protein C8R45DRAFT_570007 [Mycena sanguinolenta]